MNGTPATPPRVTVKFTAVKPLAARASKLADEPRLTVPDVQPRTAGLRADALCGQLVEEAGTPLHDVHEAPCLASGIRTVERLRFTRQEESLAAEPALHASASVVIRERSSHVGFHSSFGLVPGCRIRSRSAFHDGHGLAQNPRSPLSCLACARARTRAYAPINWIRNPPDQVGKPHGSGGEPCRQPALATA